MSYNGPASGTLATRYVQNPVPRPELTYDLGDVARSFYPEIFDAAWRKVDDGLVELVEDNQRPDCLLGLVHGPSRAAVVSVQIHSDHHGRPSFMGSCNCAVPDCAHIPALLLSALNPEGVSAGERGAQPGLESNDNAHNISSWMNGLLGAAEKQRAALRPRKNHQVVLYIIDQDAMGYATAGADSRFTIERVKVRLRNAGGYSRPEACGYSGRGHIPKYMTALDQRLFALIDSAVSRDGIRHSWRSVIRPEYGEDLLERLLETGRCHWGDTLSPALVRGEARTGRIEWVTGTDGTQQPLIRADGHDDVVVLWTHPFWYVSQETGDCGPLELELPPEIVEQLLRAPALDPQAAQWARAKLQGHPALGGLPLPELFDLDEPAESIALLPHVRFCVDDSPGAAFGPTDQPLIELTFLYDDIRVSPGMPDDVVQSFVDGKLRRVQRDLAAEAKVKAFLKVPLGFEPAGGGSFRGFSDAASPARFKPIDSGPGLAGLMFSNAVHGVPIMRKAGWIVEIDDDYPYRVIEAQPQWYGQVAPKRELDWFDLELGIEIDGERVNLLPILMRMIRDPRFRLSRKDLPSIDENNKLLVPLGQRGLIPLSGKRVRAILGTLIELYDEGALGDDDRLELSALHAPRLAELDDLFGEGTLRWAGGERLRELGRKLREFSGLREVPLPKGFCGTLRAYQQDGLNWLQFLREYGLSGILADDMGLGKTVQVLAHLLVEKSSGRMDRPCLVVAPTSAMANWFREAERFAPELRVLVLQGPARKQHFARIAEYDLVLTTYPLLTRDATVLQEQDWHCLILDEAQFIKNARTKSARSAAELKTRHRLCLTGTPMENHLGELWSLFHFLMPGLLGNRRQFGRLFRGPIEKHDDRGRRDQLVSRIRPFMLRRTKDEVALDLPPKTEIVRVVELQRGQRDLYESIRLAVHDKVRDAVAEKGLARSTIVILDALLKLRQVCCDPRLLKLEQAQKVRERAKLDLLLEMLDELMSAGRRVLLFSQFTSMLSLIEPELKARDIAWVEITGATQDRDTPVRRFQDGEVPLFLISLKAGGTALNLTAADTVIHYDPWWNPAVEAQATDRAHRIGQDKPVFVYKLITAGSVEEKIVAMQERKRDLAQGIYGAGGKQARAFSADDLESLFQPLG